jgi:hypothetical protein
MKLKSWIKEKSTKHPTKTMGDQKQMETPRGFNQTNESSEFPKVTKKISPSLAADHTTWWFWDRKCQHGLP